MLTAEQQPRDPMSPTGRWPATRKPGESVPTATRSALHRHFGSESEDLLLRVTKAF
jgi:hypothetical protein